MSNRTLVELNHDFCPHTPEQAKEWVEFMITYMTSADPKFLPDGVTFKHFRHHSEPDPLATPVSGNGTEPPDVPWSDWAHNHMTALRNAIFATIPEEEKNANMGDEKLVAWPAELAKRLESAKQYGRTEYGIEQILGRDLEAMRLRAETAESARDAFLRDGKRPLDVLAREIVETLRPTDAPGSSEYNVTWVGSKLKSIVAGAASHNGQGWVRVEDGLPEYGVDVQIWRFGFAPERREFQVVAHLTEEEGTVFWEDWTREDISQECVTHWQPLPDPPSEADGPTRQEIDNMRVGGKFDVLADNCSECHAPKSQNEHKKWCSQVNGPVSEKENK